MLNIKPVIKLLLFSLILVQLFGGVVVEANAQEMTPGIPKPVYIEPTPVKEDIAPGGWTLRAGTPDATSVETLILGTEESSIHGLIYYDGFLWASTRTAPAKIIKIDPSTPMSVETSVTLAANRNNAEDLVAANGYIWTVATVTEGNPPSGVSYLVRVDPDTMAVTYYLIRLGSSYLYYASSMEYNFGSLWVGGYNAIARIDISASPTIVAVYDYSTLVTQQYVVSTALSSDSSYLWTMFTQGTTTELISTTLARINPNNPGGDYLPQGIEAIFPDDMVNISNTLYTSSEDPGLPSYAYGFPVNITPYDTQQASSTSVSYGVFNNPLELDTFWGLYTGTPGALIKFDLNLNDIYSFTLPTGFNDPSEIAFDPSGNMYVSTFQDPARLVKYTPPDAVTLSISRSGSEAVLSWSHTDTLVDHYEIWRSAQPYFSPGDVGSTKISDVTPNDLITTTIYTDTASGIGDININYFYVARAFNDFGLLGPLSNRVGEYDYPSYTITSLTKNDIALVLEVTAVNDAASLATYLGSFVRRVSRYDLGMQSFQTYFVGLPGTNFNISTGEFIFLYTDITTPSSISLVGVVPDPGEVSFSLVSASPPLRNFISLPLDQGDLTSAANVATDIGSGVSRVFRFRNDIQSYQTYFPGLPGTDFSLVIGEPFGTLLTTGAPTSWP